MEIKQYPDIATLSNGLAEFIVKDMEAVLAKNDRYTIALSGGSTPKALYQMLAANYAANINWAKVHLFFGDERYVPFEHDDSNARMVTECLVNHVPIPAQQVHIIRTDVAPQQSAVEYQTLLHQYFDGKPHTFDLALLGMGDDGHTLSLFPGTPVVFEQQKWVSEVFVPAKDGYRITITSPVVNLAKTVVFLVAGVAKAHALNKVLNGQYEPSLVPAQIIKPVSGNLYWFIDNEAAEKLP